MEKNLENIKVLFSKEELDERISELADKITNEYNTNRDLVAICILNGAVYFYTDLTKKIKRDVTLDFMKVSSYSGTESTGVVGIKQDIASNIEGKDVIIVEDIIDTGLTLEKVKEYLKSKNPNSIKIAVLLDKKARRKSSITSDFACFDIDDKFVVGYGLDYDEKFRNLPYVGYFEVEDV